jgi:methionyl-tRNA formyltransferase
MKFAFFGTPELAVTALEEMASFNYIPSLIVTNPDAPVGRKQIITPPPTKVWAQEHNIPVFQPQSLKDRTTLSPLTETNWDVFVVLAYGKIMPEWLLSLPKYGTINAHPSLLPKLRGASPIRSTLLSDLNACGVTIMQMDKDLDHGPILLQLPVALETPIPGRELDVNLAKIAGSLLAETLGKLETGTLTPKEQDHTSATFCTKISKEMSELTLDPYTLPSGEEALTIFRTICAFDGWPETFFIHEGKRIKIKSAHIDKDQLYIDRIVPEGKNEIDFAKYFAN